MTASSRDRLSVDLHGLKAALLERSQVLGVTPSGLVRSTLAEALGQSLDLDPDRLIGGPPGGRSDRVRLCLRTSREHARATAAAARDARMPLGDYISGLVAGVPVLSAGGSRGDHIAALVASTAELSTLSRNVHRLTVLLCQANVEPARQYRDMLDTLAGDVRGHLELAAAVLSDLQPQGRPAAGSTRNGQ